METSVNVYDLVTASVFILNIFVAAIFFIRNYTVSLTYKLISLILFLLLIRTFSIHLYLSKEILNFPHFLLVSQLVARIGLPLIFLMLVFEVYQRKFRWYDALHFIPAFLFFANYWTLYSKSASEKRTIIEALYQNGHEFIYTEGTLFSDDAVFLLRVIPFTVYVLLMGFLLYKEKQQRKLSSSLNDFFTALIIYLFLNLLALLLTDVLHIFNSNSVYELNIISFITTFFILLYFFFIPNFIYHPYFNTVKEEKKQKKTTLSSRNNSHKNVEQIEQYFQLHKSFLNPDYTITQLENEIKIPARQISKAIKLIRNQNFNQFLNEYRITYLLQQVPLEKAIQTNFQDLAFQIGFNSVNNFYAHFKNHVGCTPKVYYKNLKDLQEKASDE